MSRARDLSNLANQNALSVDSSSFDVGISSSSPDSDLNVGGTIKMDGPSGVITATSYEGSGANLTGIAATDTIAAASLTVSGISTLTGVVKGLSDVRVTGNLNAGITTLGAVTVTSITGDGSGLTGVANTDVVHTREVTVSGVSTFTGDVSLGSSITSKGTSGKGGLFGHLEVGLDTKYVTIQPTGVDANRELHLNYDRGELKIAQNQVTGGGSTITAYADVHLGIGHLSLIHI